jgi:radical SAM superfamily enzyme YgiQ (UPF0313 family)
MKIVLIGINARYTHSNPAIRYLREMVADLPAETVIREFTINMDILSIADSIRKEKPDAVIFSVYIWNAPLVRKLIPVIRLLIPDACITAGGPEVSFCAEEWIREVPETDIVITGPGEAAFRELVKNGFISADTIISKENPPFAEIPFLYKSGFDGLENRYIYYESSRGCPFSCIYCLSSRGDHCLDFRPLDMVFPELDSILSKNPSLVKFVDRSFNADPSRARAIWRYLAEKNTGTQFHCEIHPLLLEDEDFTILSAMPEGLFQFEAGVQSTNKATLGEIGRPVPWEKIEDNLKRLVSIKNIHTHLDLVAGLPFDDRDSFAQAFDRIMMLKPDHIQLGFLKVLHGTALREKAENYGLIYEPFPPYEILCNKWLSADDLRVLRHIEQLTETLINSHFFDNELSLMTSVQGGWFSLLTAILSYCEQTGFDILTKNRQKLEVMIHGFKSASGKYSVSG